MIKLLFVMLISHQYKLKTECANICGHDQMMRRDNQGNYICCQTIICQKGQMYDFCDRDQGHDTCSNCPEGTYHLDTINTAMMNSILNPCIPKPTCDQPEVKLENGECVCDRSRGYYGNDINNCLLADHKCSGPGYELKNNGRCEPCAEDYFKPEASADLVCKLKTRCFETQEVDNNGTTTKDRSCRTKKVQTSVTEQQNNNMTGTADLAEVQTPVIISALVFVLVAIFVVMAVLCRKRRFISVCHSNSDNSMLPKPNTYETNLVGQNDSLYEQIYSKVDVKDSVKDLEETYVMTPHRTEDTYIPGTDDTCINHLKEPQYHIDEQSGISDKSCKCTGSMKDNTYKQVTPMSKTTDYSTSCHNCKFSNHRARYCSNRKANSENFSADSPHRSRTSKVAGVESKERYNKRINNNKKDKVSINILTSSAKKTDNVGLHETKQKLIARKPQNYSEHHNLKSPKISLTTNSSSTMFQTNHVKNEDKKVQTSFVEGLQVIEDDSRYDTNDVLTAKNIINGDKNYRRYDKNVAKIKPFVRQNTGSSSDDSEYRLLNTNPENNDEGSKVATSRAPRPVDSESMSSFCPPVDSFEFTSANQNDNEDNEDVH